MAVFSNSPPRFLTLDNFRIQLLYNRLGHGLLSPFEWYVTTPFCQSFANHVSFVFAEYIVLYPFKYACQI